MAKGNIAAIVGEVIKEFGDALKTGMSNVMGDVAKKAFIPLGPAFETFQIAAGQTIQTMLRFVEKSNPAAAFQFNRALDDLAATMGQILVPVIQGVGIFVREMADVFQGMRPAMEPVMRGISDVVVELSKMIQPLMSLFIPALQLIGTIIKEIVVPAIKSMVEAFMELVRILQEAGIIEELKKGNSIGAAVRPAAYGSIEDIGKRTTLAALGKTDRQEEDRRKREQQHEQTNSLLKDVITGVKQLAKENNVTPGEAATAAFLPSLSIARWAARQFD